MKPVIRTVSLAALIVAASLVGPPRPAVAQDEAASQEKAVWVLRFDLGGSQLTEAHLAELDKVVERLRTEPRLLARIVGHSDSQGPEPANLLVSRVRAETVRDHLVRARGIAETRITTEAKGSLRPVASNETAEGRLRNRRVVIALKEPLEAARRRAAGTWVLRFEFGGSELSRASTALLDEVAMEMRLRPELEVLIVGHSDSSGPEPINLAISQQRAEAAKGYLVRRRGIDQRRIRTQGKGSTRPIASNQTAEGQRRNRRAVVVLEDPAAKRQPTPPPVDEEAAAASAADPLPEASPRPGAETTPAATDPVSRAASGPPASGPQEDEAATAAEAPSRAQPASTAPAQPAGQAKLLTAGPAVLPPTLRHLPDPVLAKGAKAPKKATPVSLAVLVSERGRVLAVRLAGYRKVKRRFEEAAFAAAKQATFEPASRDGVAGRMWVNLVVTIPAGPRGASAGSPGG